MIRKLNDSYVKYLDGIPPVGNEINPNSLVICSFELIATCCVRWKRVSRAGNMSGHASNPIATILLQLKSSMTFSSCLGTDKLMVVNAAHIKYKDKEKKIRRRGKTINFRIQLRMKI